jgi:hypothetical protein
MAVCQTCLAEITQTESGTWTMDRNLPDPLMCWRAKGIPMPHSPASEPAEPESA